jgi:YgiT-type zinc finger domain-containing protein
VAHRVGSAWIYEESAVVKCHICAGRLQPLRTDLPFKISERTIIIIKNLPVLQCERCPEYSMDDATFARVEKILARADRSAELEIVAFAA